MTRVSIANSNPLIDGRQSARAMMVRRGLQILLTDMRHATLPELALANGRRADLVTVSEKGEIWIIEIKTSIEDFRVDRKWPDYRAYCDRLFFATGDPQGGHAQFRQGVRASPDHGRMGNRQDLRRDVIYFGARLARIRCSVRRCMLRRRAVSDTLRSHIS